MTRLPLRIRLVAGFAVAMLVVLTGAAAFVYWRVDYALDRAMDSDLQRATAVLGDDLAPDGTVTDRAAVRAAGVVYQVLDDNGRPLDHGNGAGPAPLVAPDRLPGTQDSVQLDVGPLLPVAAHPLRLEVTGVPLGRASDRTTGYLVVGVRRDHRDEALRELLGQLALAVLGSLAVATGVGYALARAALRPVEDYRSQAEAVTAGARGVRLPVPAGRDDEVTRLGRTLNDMLDALDRALETERRFVDDASHELRTPLTVLKSRVQVALRRPRTREELRDALTEVQVDIERLVDLASQLLAVRASPDASAGTAGAPATTVSDAGEAVRAVLARRRAAGQHVDGVLPADPVPVCAEPGVVEQVTDNLLANAFVHGAPPVRLSLSTNGAWVRIAVTDRGDGVEPEFLARATERFSRSPDARHRPGTGLGLAIVRALVEDTGGTLELCDHGRHHPADAGADGAAGCAHDDSVMAAIVLLPSASSTP